VLARGGNDCAMQVDALGILSTSLMYSVPHDSKGFEAVIAQTRSLWGSPKQ
jgi:hypothetical protein